MYRNLTEDEIIKNVPEILNQYKPHFRATRTEAITFAIEHLKSEESHEPHVENLGRLLADYQLAKLCDNCGVWTKRTDIRVCVDCDSRCALKPVSKEVIFNQFVKAAESVDQKLDIRYKPSAGYRAISTCDSMSHALLPGDPDMDPPTTKVNW